MTGRELMHAMLAPGFPLDAIMYVGKGMGPVAHVDVDVNEDGTDPYVVISP
jgi:hypothetical protein